MTTWPQTDDVICLTSLSIHHRAGVDMSDSPTLAFAGWLAQASTSVTFSLQAGLFRRAGDELRLLLEPPEFTDT